MPQSITDIGKKWSTRVGGSKTYFVAGTSGAASKFDAGVAGAENAYEQGVQDAISRKAWGKNTSGKGQVWANRTSTIGADRWAQGVSSSEGKYEQNFAPFYQAELSMNLGPKGATGSQQNYDRSRTMGEMLHNMRIGR